MNHIFICLINRCFLYSFSCLAMPFKMDWMSFCVIDNLHFCKITLAHLLMTLSTFSYFLIWLSRDLRLVLLNTVPQQSSTVFKCVYISVTPYQVYTKSIDYYPALYIIIIFKEENEIILYFKAHGNMDCYYCLHWEHSTRPFNH